MYFPSVCGSWIFHLYPVPLAEEQSKLAVKAVSYTVLWLDKCHHPVTPAVGFWQWIDAVKLILIFMQEVKCIRCDWLMVLQIISRWPSEALELCFRKALTNLTKDDSSWALQLLGCTKLGYENICSWDFWIHILWPLACNPTETQLSKLQPVGHGHHEPWIPSSVDALSVGSVSKASAALFAERWHQPD